MFRMEPRAGRTERIQVEGGGTVELTWTTEKKPARQLDSSDTFADGALIFHLSFQRTWIYARCIKDGKLLRRRFRYDQIVTVEKAEATYARA